MDSSLSPPKAWDWVSACAERLRCHSLGQAAGTFLLQSDSWWRILICWIEYLPSAIDRPNSIHTGRQVSPAALKGTFCFAMLCCCHQTSSLH